MSTVCGVRRHLLPKICLLLLIAAVGIASLPAAAMGAERALFAADTSNEAAAAKEEGGCQYVLADDGTAVLVKYVGAGGSVTLPSKLGGATLARIGEGAFQGRTDVTSVLVPAGVTTIDAYAFAGCTALKTVDIDPSVTSIHETAFVLEAPAADQPDSKDKAPDNPELLKLTILGDGELGSYAQTYAQKMGIAFENNRFHAHGVQLSAESLLLLNNGSSAKLTATVDPANCTDPMGWSSSNTSVVTVGPDGTVRAVGLGDAKVTFTAGNVSASCDVSVVKPVQSIVLNKDEFYLEAGEWKPLNPTVLPVDAYNRAVVWTSSAPNIASVDANGVVTGVARGTATITCTAVDGSGVSKSCLVTVLCNRYNCTEVSQLQSPHPYEAGCTDSWTYRIPGAAGLAVTFDKQTFVEDHHDFIEIYDASYHMLGTYTAAELAGTTVYVPGDYVRIRLVTDESVNEWGFKVASVNPYQPDGWARINGATYYYADGAPLRGETFIDGAWYYFDAKTGAMATGIVRLPDGMLKYYGTDGRRMVGSIRFDDGWRYFDDANGAMLLGLNRLYNGEIIYCSSPSGLVVANSERTFMGVVYRFDREGDLYDPATTDLPNGTLAQEDGGPGPAPAPRTYDLPDYTNPAALGSDALADLKSHGLSVVLLEGGNPPSSDMAGRVYMTEPAAGTKVTEGDVVTLHVYGDYTAPTAVVPDLTNVGMAEAKSILASIGFKNVVFINNGDGSEVQDGAAAVVTSVDGAGTAQDLGTLIKVHVDVTVIPPDPPTPVTVVLNDYVGGDIQLAQAELKGLGLSVNIDTDEPAPSTDQEGVIYAMDPAAGTEVSVGSTVTLKAYGRHVEPTPATVVVADYVGKDVQDAQAGIEGQKLVASVDTSVAAPSPDQEGVIYATDPAAGTEVEEGSTVTVKAYGKYIEPTPQTVVIADYVGKDLQEAQNGLAGQSLSVSVDTETPAPAPEQEGVVYATDPAAGTEVEVGSTVTVKAYGRYIEPEPQTVVVADYTGQSAQAAQQGLEDEGLEVTVDTSVAAPSPDQEGVVYDTNPVAGTEVEVGSTVTVDAYGDYVEPTPQTVVVANYVGQSAQDAQAGIEGQGLVASIDTSVAAPSPEQQGVVYATDPAAGTEVEVGSTVTVSAYGDYVEPTPATVTIGDYTGWDIQSAQGDLEGKGLSVGVDTNTGAPSPEQAWTVYATDPGAGTEVEAGSYVTVLAYGDYVEPTPATVTIGDYTGWDIQSAQGDLEGKGLSVGVDTNTGAPSPEQAWTVYATDPGAGTEVEAGSYVTVLAYGDYVEPEPFAPAPSPAQAERAQFLALAFGMSLMNAADATRAAGEEPLISPDTDPEVDLVEKLNADDGFPRFDAAFLSEVMGLDGLDDWIRDTTTFDNHEDLFDFGITRDGDGNLTLSSDAGIKVLNSAYGWRNNPDAVIIDSVLWRNDDGWTLSQTPSGKKYSIQVEDMQSSYSPDGRLMLDVSCTVAWADDFDGHGEVRLALTFEYDDQNPYVYKIVEAHIVR